jgi:cellulose synthase operon protein C
MKWRVAPAGLTLLLVVTACARSIDPGPQIRDLAGERDRPPVDKLPVVETPRVGTDAAQAFENYQKLLDLPQDPATRAETLRRLADLQLELDEAGEGDSPQSELRLRQSIALYDTLLKEHPQDPRNDRLLYQLSRAYQNLGELQRAEAILQRLTREYPQSAYADEAHFRHGELLFRLGQFEDAAREYRQVLTRRERSPFFDAAQYKYGWALYRQSKFEEAVDVFLAILARELPPGEHSDPQAAIERVAIGKRDLAKDSLRVVSLSLASLGSDGITRYFSTRPRPVFTPLIHTALGELLMERERYTDAAGAYGAFIELHPRHALAPAFRGRAIASLHAGGFGDLVVAEKEKYVAAYDPSAPYWTGRNPAPEVLKELRVHLEDLARHYQARGQRTRESDSARAQRDFQAAAKSWRRLLELYPQDPQRGELRFLLGEALYEAGDTLAAAQEYNRVVAEAPDHARAPEAAYAALLAYQRHSREVPAEQKTAALRFSVQAGLQLAERYPKHPQALAALTRAAEDLYLLESWNESLAAANRVLQATPQAPAELRRAAWGVAADIHFSQKRHPEAERAIGEVLKLTPADSKERTELEERLAASIYRQGEAAREAGNLPAAAATFLRVGQAVPGASIRANADYDAAAMFIALKDWPQAIRVLESFRSTHRTSPLLPEVDKQLAVVYQNSGRSADAAAVLARIAGRGGEAADTRRDAAWLAVTLLDQAKDPRTATEYDAYLKQYPQPLDRAMQARHRLAELARARGDTARQQHWLREIVNADTAAGEARTPRSRELAAEASLELGRMEARTASAMPLRLPLKDSLPPKRRALERAIETLTRAADYGIADVTTAATYELGQLYQNFSKTLLESDRPRLPALELEQYNLLLEEQAFPFEERAIEWHEANLQRAGQGVYNEWVGRSLQALASLVPARYGKREQTTDVYDALR